MHFSVVSVEDVKIFQRRNVVIEFHFVLGFGRLYIFL